MSYFVSLHIEVCQKAESMLQSSVIKKEFEKYFTNSEVLTLNTVIREAVLPDHVQYFRICSSPERGNGVNLQNNVPKTYYIYKLWEESPEEDPLVGEEEVPASLNWCLPNSAFEGLWESLIFDEDIKDQLMTYMQTALAFSTKQVNTQIIHWNGIVLLHGPPGTGKTSLCKGLAQKLSIRMNSRYRTVQLIEINTHSLFSKWFSESAKLVLKMFSSITRWLQTEDHFVCILLDEVESLTQARKSNECEPSDSIRVVNALLTQIDQLQRYSNFLILATTNMKDTIDSAFADRADLKLYIQNPSVWGAYNILKTCLDELVRCNLVKGSSNDFFDAAIFMRMKSKLRDIPHSYQTLDRITQNSETLLMISMDCLGGLSGRMLRKVPFLTSTKFVDKEIPSLSEFLSAMEHVLRKLKDDERNFIQTRSAT